jgi:hypothetical protein
MTDVFEQMAGSAAYQPTDDDRASVAAWFTRYDTLAANGDLEGMADQAVFPLNVVSDSTDGGSAEQWTRERFIQTMGEVTAGSGDVKLESTRHPIFLSANLAFVVTDATMTMGGQSQPIRYADLLIKVDGAWRFQTMAQPGWA